MKNPIKKKDKKEEENGLIRGGSWFNYARVVRVSNRRYDDPSYRSDGGGLRIVRTKKNEKSD